MIDEIHEEIKREDFFNQLKKIAPFLLAGILLVLGAAAIGSWKQARDESRLVRDERLYESALSDLQEGRFHKAETAFSQLAQNSKGMAPLAWLQSARAAQIDFSLTDSSEAAQRVLDYYGHVRSSLPLDHFLTTAQMFMPEKLASRGHYLSFKNPQTPWYLLWLAHDALTAYKAGDPQAIGTAFSMWDRYALQFYSPAMQWLAHYCKMGSILKHPTP